jgi:autotransporter-associated beta strand protein
LTGGAIVSTAPTAPVSLNANTDPIQVNLSYDGSNNLTETLTDLTLNTTYSASYAIGDLTTLVGGNTALLGFSGADGGVSSTQAISNFSFSYTSAATNNILPTTTGLSIASSATLDLFGTSQTVGSISGAGTVTNSNPGTFSLLTVGGDGTSQTFSGTLQDGAGTLSLDKTGAGTLVLSGTNTYSGGTTVNAGTLVLDSPVAIATGSSLTVGQGASSVFATAGGAVAASQGARVEAVPEPGTLALLGASAVGLVWYARRKRKPAARRVVWRG